MADENNNQYYTPPQENQQPYTPPPQGYNQFNGNMPPREEKASVGLAILSFIIPLVGLILFIVKKDKKPKTAKACGICALVSFIINIVITVIMAATSGALFSQAVDKALDDSSYSEEYDNELDASAEEGSADTSDNIIGDYGCVVKEATLCKDWENKDAVLITYEFTNNSSDAASFDVSLSDSVYQDGVGLETAILDEDTDLVDVEIKPGVTKDVKKAYVLRDTSTPLEVEISEWLSFDDDKIVTTVNIK